ncbi:acyl transferase domain-containing protein [Saccharothrix tamanrassetensis]|uniref:Acyl transferase domain-containing protein n=1 Tax=Saccharothrix tamanrassetensis TaxID=1051531 RepID=A0A841CRY4_9PSEU|nr:beta-ketoacyl synthase N-terminal-like domain-containing protein [Saccharothrix tamanrassetensis]MBB5958236.1 acyl transferase domain-containing protein [Saccharothrix tamanrassetensis]
MTDTHIAVVGMAGRFAGTPDLDAYWQAVSTGTTVVRELTTDELLAAGEDPALLADPAYVRRYGKLDRAEWFDAEFFGYAPVDAVLSDPQHRVFLETCWQAMEDAGYPPSATDAVVGVYGGCGQSRYWSLVGRHRDRFPGLDDVRLAMVAGADHLCLRVSHKLGLTGPSMTVLSTCSTALVAVHQACQALLFGDCDMALAGGVSVRVPARGAVARAGSVLSPDGVCRAFDAKANGTVFGDGAGVVLLKRYADAVDDGDHIHAVIRGSAVNNDGSDRVGYGAPGVSGQAKVIRSALAAAEVAPETVDYVESHGTGTQVGDPIEVAALTRAFGGGAAGSTVLGTVKPNIGHTDAAAGIAGLLKVILALRHRVLPPSVNFEQPNPAIDFAAGPFEVRTEAAPWPERGRPRRAGVSSFGIGATNAHVVVEEAPSPEPAGPPRTHRLLVLSATTVPALRQMRAELAAHLTAHPEQSLDDVAYTLQVGRVGFPHRWCAVVTDRADAVRALTAEDAGPDHPAHERFAPDRQAHDRQAHDHSGGTAADELHRLGEQWMAGEAIRPVERRRRVPLPTYPFQRRRHIVESAAPTAAPPAAAPPAAAPPPAARPVAPVASSWQPAEIVETVALLFAEVLQQPEVDADDDFFALGGDSLIAVGLIARIDETFDVSLTPEEVFSDPTPAGVATVIGELLKGEQ